MSVLRQRPEAIDFRALYRRAGLRKNSHCWKEYERGKRLLIDIAFSPEDMGLTPDQYEEGIKALTEYLKV